MSNDYFQFKKFRVEQKDCAMKVTTDACLFGAWVAEILEKKKEKKLQILDVGAGTGLLSLMLAQKTNSLVDAVEIDLAAAKQCGENFENSDWAARLHVVQEDIRQYQPAKKFNFIICNPPFYENILRTTNIAVNQARHDESLTLKELPSLFSSFLVEGGEIAILIPAQRADDFKKYLAVYALNVYHEAVVRHSEISAPIRYMYIFGVVPRLQKSELISIKKSEEEYSDRFVQLLKDYYLNL